MIKKIFGGIALALLLSLFGYIVYDFVRDGYDIFGWWTLLISPLYLALIWVILMVLFAMVKWLWE